MTPLAIAPVLAFFSLLQIPASAPTMTGKWDVQRQVEGRVGKSVCTFEQQEKALTGTCTFAGKEVPVNGAIDGDTVTWKQAVNVEGATSLTYTAPLRSEKLSGNVAVEPLGVTGYFTATRIQ